MGARLRRAAYLVVALGTVDVNWARVSEGAAAWQALLDGFLAPDFTARWSDIVLGMSKA